MEKICRKSSSKDWGIWTSTKSGKEHFYCRPCRRIRATHYTTRKVTNGGKHTNKEWIEKLALYDKCPLCNNLWQEIMPRPDKRYKNVWTKDHIVPLNKGGDDNIENIQPVCYRCNSAKCDRILNFDI